MIEPRGFTAELPPQPDPEIGHELIRVSHDDGHTEELRLHDYARVYSLPGLYEQIVQQRLGCGSPEEMASLLAGAVDELGWERGAARVIDIAAGNGISGEALAAQGLKPVLGTDIVEAAREAALRDRPDVYDDYETLDLLALSSEQKRAVRGLAANVLSCVAPVGIDHEQLPPEALTAVAALLTADALVGYMHDPALAAEDPITEALWAERLGAETRAELIARRRYLHRYTVNGRRYEMDGVVWHLRRH